jgi:hypothetical protein
VSSSQVANPVPILFRDPVYNHPDYSEIFTSRNYLTQKGLQACRLEMIVGVDVATVHAYIVLVLVVVLVLENLAALYIEKNPSTSHR